MNIIEQLNKEHYQKFGKEPVVIGMFWSSQERMIDLLDEALEKNIHYDEYKMLSKDEQDLYDQGDLLF